MSVLSCTYPESNEVAGILNQLRTSLSPFQVICNEEEVYTRQIHRLETLLDKEAMDKDTYIPLLTIKQNARVYGPQYEISVVLDGSEEATGSINKRSVSLICENSPSTALFNKMVDFASEIPGATIEHRDKHWRSLL